MRRLLDGRPWFAPMRYGIGGRPDTVEGWLATALYIASVVALRRDIVRTIPAGRGPLWIALALVTMLFVFVCWRRTRGGWRWRWGD